MCEILYACAVGTGYINAIRIVQL